MRLFLAILVGKTISFLTQLFHLGGGSAAPGYYALKIEPKLIQKLNSQIPQRIAIAGTNGKTTTAKMLNHLLESQNLKILRNHTGSNLDRGVASALISASNLLGHINGTDMAIWELDEAAFNKLNPQLKPNIIVFLNAYRDQLDRYGEIDSVIRSWQNTLEKTDWNPKVIVNNQDPNTARLTSLKDLDFTTFDVINHQSFMEKVKHIFSKTSDITAKITQNKGLKGFNFEIKHPTGSIDLTLNIPGLYHVYAALAAFCVYYELNLPINDIGDCLESFTPAFGRVETLDIKGVQSYLFLIKNPAGANAVFETISPELKPKDHLLLALNDNFADGTDVSWIWDANFEKLFTLHSSLVTCTGTRSHDLALRLKYAGVDPAQITIINDPAKALNSTLHNADRLFILPTYTALLELQKIFTQKGYKKAYWRAI